MSDAIEAGQTVQLKSGGQTMTVGVVGAPGSSLSTGTPHAQVFWFDGPRLCWDTVPLAALVPAVPARTVTCGHCGLHVVVS